LWGAWFAGAAAPITILAEQLETEDYMFLPDKDEQDDEEKKAFESK